MGAGHSIRDKYPPRYETHRETVMSVLRWILILALAWGSLPAQAATDCYFLAGVGQGSYTRSFIKQFEQKLLDQPDVKGSTEFDPHSRPYQLGGGCRPWRYLAIEVDYFGNFQTEVNTTFVVCTDIQSRSRCSGTMLTRRKLTLEGFEFSGLGFLPITERLAFTARLGIMRGRAEASLQFPQASMPLQISAEKQGVIPVVGVGLLYQANRDFSLAIEEKRFDGYSRTQQVLLRWHF